MSVNIPYFVNFNVINVQRLLNNNSHILSHCSIVMFIESATFRDILWISPILIIIQFLFFWRDAFL